MPRTSPPVCLVSDEHDLTPRMQKMLEQLGQKPPKIKPILELNPGHPLLPKDWAKVTEGSRDGKPFRRVSLTSRGPVSHGCTRLDDGHLAELREMLPSTSAAMEGIVTYRNVSHCYDVFDPTTVGDSIEAAARSRKSAIAGAGASLRVMAPCGCPRRSAARDGPHGRSA